MGPMVEQPQTKNKMQNFYWYLLYMYKPQQTNLHASFFWCPTFLSGGLPVHAWEQDQHGKSGPYPSVHRESDRGYRGGVCFFCLFLFLLFFFVCFLFCFSSLSMLLYVHVCVCVCVYVCGVCTKEKSAITRTNTNNRLSKCKTDIVNRQTEWQLDCTTYHTQDQGWQSRRKNGKLSVQENSRYIKTPTFDIGMSS